MQIKPLPNLDYKIVTGNSLLGVEKNIFNQEYFKRLEELKPKYFDEANSDRKHDYKREIDGLIHQLTNGKATFDYEIYFSEVFHNKGGFNVVIGNPPYGETIKDNKKSTGIVLKIEGDINLPLPGLMKMVVAPVVEGEFEKLVDKYIANLIKRFGGEV